MQNRAICEANPAKGEWGSMRPSFSKNKARILKKPVVLLMKKKV